MKEIRNAEKNGTLTDTMKLFSSGRKPVEELYDLEADPHEINNLAEDPAHKEKLDELRKELADWQFNIGDIGLLPESEIERRESDVPATWEILRQSGDGSELIAKLVEVATKASQGTEAIPDLTAALAHEDPAIRYWGATGLGNFADAAKDTAAKLEPLLADPTPAVRIAAGRALCRMGITEKALPLLGRELSGDLEWARLEASIALDYLEEAARPVLPELKKALKNQPNKYIIRVANRAVNDLEGTEAKVP